jgi:endonuclease I
MLVLVAQVVAYAQTTLSAGDVVVLGYNYDNPDQVKFVPLVDLASGTVIKFTDNGWTGSALSTTEGTDTWTASSAVAKGTILTLNATSMALGTSGDQVFAYQGNATSPTFVFGLTTRPWVTGSISASTSRKPASLTAGVSCIAFATERDNGQYNVLSTTGNMAAIQSAVCNSSNWSLTDSRINTFNNWSISINSFANEPAANPINLSFSAITSYSYQVGFSAVTADGFLMIRSRNGAPSAEPVDGVVYQRGDQIGNAKVITTGLTTSFNVVGTRAGEANYVQVFAYNGSGANINYRQVGPLSGNLITSATGEGNYYAAIDPASSSFISDLQNRIRTPYTKVNYDQYDETMMTNYAVSDTTGNQRVAKCVYSGQVYTYTAPFAWYTATPFSREHTWCVSWTPTNATSSAFEYCDQHHLYPVNQTNANAVRSNHPLGDVATVISSYLDGQYGYDVNGNVVYEPRDAQKGDAARAILYMSLRYNGVNGFDWTLDYLNNVTLLALGEDPQDIATLLAWHQQDAPDGYEIARNDYIASIQGNRNPFIDHPEWTQRIAFGDLSYVPMPAIVAPADDVTLIVDQTVRMDVYPNPASEIGVIALESSADVDAQLVIYDLRGRVVMDQKVILAEGRQVMEVNTAAWQSGLYIVHLLHPQGNQTIKWMIE